MEENQFNSQYQTQRIDNFSFNQQAYNINHEDILDQNDEMKICAFDEIVDIYEPCIQKKIKLKDENKRRNETDQTSEQSEKNLDFKTDDQNQDMAETECSSQNSEKIGEYPDKRNQNMVEREQYPEKSQNNVGYLSQSHYDMVEAEYQFEGEKKKKKKLNLSQQILEIILYVMECTIEDLREMQTKILRGEVPVIQGSKNKQKAPPVNLDELKKSIIFLDRILGNKDRKQRSYEQKNECDRIIQKLLRYILIQNKEVSKEIHYDLFLKDDIQQKLAEQEREIFQTISKSQFSHHLRDILKDPQFKIPFKKGTPKNVKRDHKEINKQNGYTQNRGQVLVKIIYEKENIFIIFSKK